MTRFSHARRGLALAVAALAAVVAAPVFAADSVVPPRDRVKPSDLPSVAQVAGLYPNLRGGTRDVYRDRYFSVLNADCLTYNSLRATTGTWASYEPRPGRPDYFDGKASPGVFVYKFHTRAGVRSALNRIRADVAHCTGTFGSPDDYESILAPVTVPALGESAVGFRTRRGAINSVSNEFDPDYFVEVWVRKGRYLINVRTQKDLSAPSVAPVIKLARIATRRAG